jgi:hypothetical protein
VTTHSDICVSLISANSHYGSTSTSARNRYRDFSRWRIVDASIVDANIADGIMWLIREVAEGEGDGRWKI